MAEETIHEQHLRTLNEQAQALTKQLNDYALGNYRGALVQWKQQHDWAKANGQPDRPKPEPPFSVIVIVHPDARLEFVSGPQMKDETPVDPPPPPAGVGKLGPFYYQDIWACDPTDTAPVGYILEDSTGRYKKIVLGRAGLYAGGVTVCGYQKIG